MSDGFYSITIDGLETHATEESAREAAEYDMTLHDDHWPENIECTEYGRLVPIAVTEEYDRKDREDYTEQEWEDEGFRRDWDYTASYRLVPADPAPADPVQFAAVQMAMGLAWALHVAFVSPWQGTGREHNWFPRALAGEVNELFGGSLEREP